MSYFISKSGDTLWLSIGNDRHIEIKDISDLEKLNSGNIDQALNKRILKEIHRLRSTGDKTAFNFHKPIIALTLLVGSFWLGTAHLYTLQSLQPKGSIPPNPPVATESPRACPLGAGSGDRSNYTPDFSNTIKSLEQSNHVATEALKLLDGKREMTDEEMDQEKYSFGYN